jgi:hypothetical protein
MKENPVSQVDKIRSFLYEAFPSIEPIFNPQVGDEMGNIVDLTFDVSNHTKFYHERTDEVRALLAGCAAVVTDNPQLAQVIQQFNRRSIAVPFGYTSARDASGPFTVGILNHDDDTNMANTWASKILKAIDRPLLVYGYELNSSRIEQVVTEDFDEFAGRCDVLLLPGIPQSITSLTLPLATMMAGTVVLASNGGSWYSISAAAGVVLMPPGRKEFRPWKAYLDAMEREPRKVEVMKQKNVAYVQNVNASSRRIIGNLAQRLVPVAREQVAV